MATRRRDRPKPDGGAEPKALTAREAAAWLGVHERTVRRAVARGDLAADKRHGRFEIQPAALDAYRQRLDSVHASTGRAGRAADPLPVPPTPIVGREAELAVVADLLSNPAVRLLTFTGPGGVGKTRLALAVAAACAAPGDAVFVPLESVRDPEAVPEAVARALGVEGSPAEPLRDGLARAVRRRRLLLVLDNAEHVLPAVGLVADLLAAGPALRVVATSRELLRLRGEHEVIVPPLSLPDPALPATRDAVASSPAVSLFAARARAADGGFALTDANAVTIAAICRRLDGLPLAIELAAARVKHLPPADLLGRLVRRDDPLAGGARDAPERHRTMHAAIVWSHDLLTEPERALFRRLAVLEAGFDADAAQAVASAVAGAGGRLSAKAATDALGSLLDKSLVQARGETGGRRRFALLETVREFALQRLAEAGEAPAARAAHAVHYLAAAEGAAAAFHGPDEVAALDRLEADGANLRAALAWSAREGGPETGLRIAGALWWFWYVRGHHREGRRWLAALLADPRAAEHPDLRARAVLDDGWLAIRMLDVGEAEARFAEARDAFRVLGDASTAAYAVAGLGYAAFLGRGDGSAAAAYLHEALAGGCGDVRWREAGLYFGLAIAALMVGDGDAAWEWGQRALALARADGDAQGAAATLATLAAIARLRGDAPAALAMVREAVPLFRHVGDRGNVCTCLESCAGLLVGAGEAERAARLFGAAAALREAIGTPVPVHERPRCEADAAAARTALGDAAFAAAWRSGEAMPLDAALELAAETPGGPRPDGRSRPNLPLTRRERQVLLLVAAGCTDKEIARELGITPATAGKHVGNALARLGVSSRSAAVARVAAHAAAGIPDTGPGKSAGDGAESTGFR